jgi:hypothetical protein
LLLLLAQSTLPPALQNDYIQSLILGIVEGLTEFLPVSSTAHLRITEMLLKMPLETGYWKMYTVVIQLGAILALPVYFMPRILKLLSTFPDGERGDRTVLTHPLSLVMIAFVITAGPAFLLEKQIGKNLDNFYVIGVALLIGGFLMWIIDATYGWSRSRQRGFDIVTATIADQGKAEHSRFHVRRHQQPLSNQQHGRDDAGAGVLDRGVPDSVSRLPRHQPIDVDHRRRTSHRHVAPRRPGIFVFPFHSHDDRRHPVGIEKSRLPQRRRC